MKWRELYKYKVCMTSSIIHHFAMFWFTSCKKNMARHHQVQKASVNQETEYKVQGARGKVTGVCREMRWRQKCWFVQKSAQASYLKRAKWVNWVRRLFPVRTIHTLTFKRLAICSSRFPYICGQHLCYCSTRLLKSFCFKITPTACPSIEGTH